MASLVLASLMGCPAMAVARIAKKASDSSSESDKEKDKDNAVNASVSAPSKP